MCRRGVDMIQFKKRKRRRVYFSERKEKKNMESDRNNRKSGRRKPSMVTHALERGRHEQGEL